MADKAPFATRRPIVRRDLLESLESRQLMAGFSANFNFQPAGSPTPADYVADTGKTFGSRSGQQFGWDRDNTAQTRDRKTSADARYDTLTHLGRPGQANKWEVAVPNGRYAVHTTAGDASWWNGSYALALEGQTVLNETPSRNNRWSESDATVLVNDGRLTLTSAGGSFNKLTSIQITQVAAENNNNPTGAGLTVPAKPTWSAASTNSSSSITFSWTDSARNEQGYIVERSTDNNNFSEVGRVGANVTRFTATNLSANTLYYFRARAFNAAGRSAFSPVAYVRTHANAQVAPAATGWSSAAANGQSSIRLAWNDVSNETGYAIQRSTNGSAFGEVARVGANATSYTDNGLSASTKYYYRIRSYNNAGGNTAGTVSATTTAQPSRRPDAPAWVTAQTSSSTAANLQWGDVANETGYVIERSTNGGTFGEIGRVNANVTTRGVTGLNPSTRYTFRVKAYNGNGLSGATNSSQVTTPGNPAPTPTPTPNPDSSQFGSRYSVSGISANGSGTSANAYKATLDDVGVKNVRIWYSTDSWTGPISNWYVQRAASYKAAGYKVMLAVLNPNPTDANTARAFYQRLVGNSTLKNSVDYWQVNNEPNHHQFWRGSLQQYVTTNLKPASEVLRAAGETVVGAGPTWDVNALRTMVAAGYNNYVDYAAFHPYGDSAAQVIQRATEAKAAVGNKPIMFTEWNIKGLNGNVGSWTNQLQTAAAGLSRIGAMSYYFAMVTSNTDVGRGGLLNGNGSRNTPFYNAMKDWMN